MEDDKFGG